GVAPEQAGKDWTARIEIKMRFLAAALKPGAPTAVLVLLEQLPQGHGPAPVPQLRDRGAASSAIARPYGTGLKRVAGSPRKV
ncbi:MAG TPA: hypothetical protein VIH93_03505, partial [Thermoanaerobaculia bacterium]